MNNSKVLFEDIKRGLLLDESDDELDAIAFMILQHVFGLTRTQMLAGTTTDTTSEQLSYLREILDRINQHEPIQYVLGYADFFGRRFTVNKDVLIPRPETEELVIVVKSFLQKRKAASAKVLDIGTGSGCIPITLALDIPTINAIGIDISEDALRIASRNAITLNSRVNFQKLDILLADIPFEQLDVIVSNPPYIGRVEAASIQENVLLHEPHLALFVDHDDVLIFYRNIVRKGFSKLVAGGMLAFETNEKFGDDVKQVMSHAGYNNVTVQKDINGKDRIVYGYK
ncbi:MAG TPA: peptide chain release factor N(5)-glutamine methyltransferase [Chryseosolibacter sp.]|nr:peptide chain release factor N(5)-glutamine methyltransferase [Chryseosolibacter sp.]